MMKPRLFCLWLLLSAAVGLSAQSFKYGELGYRITDHSKLTVTVMPYNLFFYDTDYSKLSSVSIPTSVPYRGKNYSVTSIDDWAFDDCSGLTSITIPSSVTNIENGAFYGCSGLTSITIPSSVTNIGDQAFNGCSGLTSIIVESGNQRYDSRNNCNAIIETATNTLIAGCRNTTISSSVRILEMGHSTVAAV